MSTTLLRRAAWMIRWDAAAGRHEYVRDADLVWRDGRILHAGPSWDGVADAEIDGAGLLVMPGLVNVHSHPTTEPLYKGIMEERGSPLMGMSALFEYMALFQPDDVTRRAAARFAMGELLLSGCTTVVDYSAPRGHWVSDMAATGVRGVIAPSFRAGKWRAEGGRDLIYEWDAALGREGMAQAKGLIDEAEAHPSGRMSGMVTPGQTDTCDEALLQDAAALARSRGLPLQIHAAFGSIEFREMLRRYGLTPVGWLDSIGFLGADTTLGHCIFVDDHPWVMHPVSPGAVGDVERVARSGAGVAHCPNVYARRGIVLNHFGRYDRMGIRMTIGTDSFPHNMLEEMRLALTLAKVMGRSFEATSLDRVFHAATVGGSAALLRDDLGRLSPGAAADLVLVDLAHPSMQPMLDPLRSLVFGALERPVRDVFVAGQQVVRDGRVLTVDMAGDAALMREGQARARVDAATRDWAHRAPDALFPPALPFAAGTHY